MFTCSSVHLFTCSHVSCPPVHLLICLPVHLCTCSGRVGRTFRSDVGSRWDEIEFDPDSLAFGENDDGEVTRKGEKGHLICGVTVKENESVDVCC